MTTLAGALREATARLSETSDTARLDAELLMAHALGVSRSQLLLHHMQDSVPQGFAALVRRRVRHEPLAYIVWNQEFYGLRLEVTPDVLIPRGDSEVLVEAAREVFGKRPPPACILDMGTGSGALLLAALALWPLAEGVGIDASAAALAVAERNARSLGLENRVTMLELSWLEAGWADDLGRFDLVLCNPPYVEADARLDASVAGFEPSAALYAGSEGLDDYRAIIPQLPGLLSETGAAIVEIGASQDEQVAAIARQAGFHAMLRRDLAARPRALILTQGAWQAAS